MEEELSKVAMKKTRKIAKKNLKRPGGFLGLTPPKKKNPGFEPPQKKTLPALPTAEA